MQRTVSSLNKQNESHIGANLSELMKKIVLAFCEVNVRFTSRLDIYGSIHVRADDCDVTSFVLNEHTYNQVENTNCEGDTVYERHTSDSKGNALERVSVCRNVSATRGVRNSHFSQLKPATSGSTVRHKSSSSPESAVEIQSSNSDDDEKAEQNRCNAAVRSTWTENNAGNVSVVRNLTCVTRLSSEKRELVKDSPCNDAVAYIEENPEFADEDLCENESDSIICGDETKKLHSSSIKVEPGVDEMGTSDFEPDDGSHHWNAGESNGLDSVSKRVYKPTTSSLCQSGDNSSVQALTRTSGWFKAAEYSASASSHLITADSSQTLCGYCMQSFTCGAQLKMHIQQVHADRYSSVAHNVGPARQHCHVSASGLATDGNVAEKYSCSVCGLPFRSLDGLRCHENTKHSRNKLYRCQFCAQSFLTRQASYTHRIKFHRLVTKKLHPV